MKLRGAAQALLLLVAVRSASAQQSRLSVTLLAGRQWNGPIFSHEVSFFVDSRQVRSLERLEVPEATRAGARVSYRVAGPWLVYAEGAYGGSHVGYVLEQRVTTPGGQDGFQRSERRKPARVTTLGAGVGRSFALPRGLPELALTVGGALQRFSLDAQEQECGTTSQGYLCVDGDPWESHYSVPSLSGGVLLRQALTRNVGIELRGAGSVGRANTEGFYEDLVPSLDAFEAPRRQTVRTGEVSLGLSVRP
jgi:hypothetical protein